MTGSLPDLTNGLFEAIGGFMNLLNCWAMYKDKAVKGVNVWASVFFTSWGFWNLYYYPHLSQWWSFSGGVLIVASNTLWVLMAIYYIRKKKVE